MCDASGKLDFAAGRGAESRVSAPYRETDGVENHTPGSDNGEQESLSFSRRSICARSMPPLLSAAMRRTSVMAAAMVHASSTVVAAAAKITICVPVAVPVMTVVQIKIEK